MVRNVTLTFDAEVLRKARVIAAERGLSLSALIRAELVRLVDESAAFASAREAALRRLRAGSHLGGGRLPTRDELHDRHALR